MVNPQSSQQSNSLTNKDLLQEIMKSGNPAQAVRNLAMRTPQGQQVLNMLQGGNMSPKQLFYQMAQQKGINPQQILNQLMN